MQQVTKEQAIRIYESGLWKDWTNRQIVEFQLFQDKLAIPFGVFAKAVNNCLGRLVYTHEFSESNKEALIAEFLGDKQAPSLDDVLALLPKEELIIIEQ